VQYAGQNRDSTTGNYQLGSRTYDPSKAGFLTPDSYRDGPAQSDLGVGIDPLTRDTYNYVNGDPINLIDPSGHMPCLDDFNGKAMCYGTTRTIGREAKKVNQREIASAVKQLIQAITQQITAKQQFDAYVRCAYENRWVAVMPSTQMALESFRMNPDLCTDIAGPIGAQIWNNLASIHPGLVDSLPFVGDFKSCFGSGSITGCINSGLDAMMLVPGLDIGDAAVRAGVEGAERTFLKTGAKALEDTAESDRADASISCLPHNSFTADTPVLMADGTTERIADVKVGDLVLATDPETDTTAARPVVALIRHTGKHRMVNLRLSDGSQIAATDHHPFWDATTDSFTDAVDLHLGDLVLSADGALLRIVSERVYTDSLTAYNLQIDGIHTYYAGHTPILVHNSCDLGLDATGKVHGSLPDFVPNHWTADELQQLEDDLTQSIATRQAEQRALGEDPAHRLRIDEEVRLLRQIQKILSGS
jgi:RHS repeat-associated protein